MGVIQKNTVVGVLVVVLGWVAPIWATVALAASGPHIFQRPALSKDLIAFGYAGDL